MASTSILSPERRIELNPFDVDAWNLLLREAQGRHIDQARNFYEKLVVQFPSAGRYWKIYIEHELRTKNFEKVESLFSRCLVSVLNVDLWKCYTFYVRETKSHLPSFREKMAQAYDFALDKVGLDIGAYSIYNDYITFLKTVPAVGQYAENQRISAIRKVFQRGIGVPMTDLETLWNDYCTYERGINQTLAEKLIADKNKEYQAARRAAKSMEQIMRGINRQAISIPPRGLAVELKQAELWRRYIQWEKDTPLNSEEYAQYAKRGKKGRMIRWREKAPSCRASYFAAPIDEDSVRKINNDLSPLVVFAYEQALLCLGFMPDIWYEAALFQQQAAQHLAEKGDVKQSTAMINDTIQLYERATTGILQDNQLLHFAYADFEEERRNYDNVKKIYDRLLAKEHVDPTLTYIQLMKFTRRTEGVKAARTVFKRAREDPRSLFHIYVASAAMEYYCSKEPQVALRIFDLGLKSFPSDPEYALAFVDFLAHLNEDNNTRVVFERILSHSSKALPPEKSMDIWDRYLEFEAQVGDLSSVLKVDQRRREAVKEQYGDRQALLLIDRYRFLNLAPCSLEQLKFMGYTKQNRFTSSIINPPSTANGPSSQHNGTQHARSAIPTSSAHILSGLDIGGFSRPDTSQMIPFKPKMPPAVSYHPVPGGVFPPPLEAQRLLHQLPPPWTFLGPFPDINLLMKTLSEFNRELPSTSNSKEAALDTNATFGGYRAADVKKEFHQLLNTTNDPMAVLASQEYQPSGGQSKKKRPHGGDSDSEDEATRHSSTSGDIYKRRMNLRGTD